MSISDDALDREPDEDCAVPQGVGEYYGAESFREETVGQTPDEARYYGRHYQHEVELGDMDEAVDKGRDNKSDIGIPSF